MLFRPLRMSFSYYAHTRTATIDPDYWKQSQIWQWRWHTGSDEYFATRQYPIGKGTSLLPYDSKNQRKSILAWQLQRPQTFPPLTPSKTKPTFALCRSRQLCSSCVAF